MNTEMSSGLIERDNARDSLLQMTTEEITSTQWAIKGRHFYSYAKTVGRPKHRPILGQLAELIV